MSVSPASRRAHDDAPVELAQVVGVHRLPELEHHVVGDVDDRVIERRPARRRRSCIQTATSRRGECRE